MPTRKLLEAIADIINSARSEAEQLDHQEAEDDGDNLVLNTRTDITRQIADELANVLAREDPKFDRHRFLAACGWEDFIMARKSCDGCNGSGIRIEAPNHSGIEVPPGWIVIERCVSCGKYESDLEAARAYRGGGGHLRHVDARREDCIARKPRRLAGQPIDP
jgi:hypothetical protein